MLKRNGNKFFEKETIQENKLTQYKLYDYKKEFISTKICLTDNGEY